MTGKNFDLKNLIRDAWENTLKKTAGVDDSAERSTAQINRERSIDWVDYLGKGFREYYNNDDQCVFWRKNQGNRKQFGLNELLFDISVCQIKEVPSIRHGKPLPFVSKCYWQVESELNDSDSREITKDFSKLVMGHSDNKLFISSYRDNHQKRSQEKVFKNCSLLHRKTISVFYRSSTSLERGTRESDIVQVGK